MLARTQSRNGLFLTRVTQQVVTANAAYGDNLPRAQCANGAAQSLIIAADIIALAPRRIPPQLRSAHWASQRLSVEPPIQRMGILGSACRTEREIGHRSVRPIVRQVADQGVAGSTLGAVDKGVAVAARRRVAQLREALVTGKQIKRYMNLRWGGIDAA